MLCVLSSFHHGDNDDLLKPEQVHLTYLFVKPKGRAVFKVLQLVNHFQTTFIALFAVIILRPYQPKSNYLTNSLGEGAFDLDALEKLSGLAPKSERGFGLEFEFVARPLTKQLLGIVQDGKLMLFRGTQRLGGMFEAIVERDTFPACNTWNQERTIVQVCSFEGDLLRDSMLNTQRVNYGLTQAFIFLELPRLVEDTYAIFTEGGLPSFRADV